MWHSACLLTFFCQFTSPNLQEFELCLILIKVLFLWKHLRWSALFIYMCFTPSAIGGKRGGWLVAEKHNSTSNWRSTHTCWWKLSLKFGTDLTDVGVTDLHDNPVNTSFVAVKPIKCSGGTAVKIRIVSNICFAELIMLISLQTVCIFLWLSCLW